MVKALIFDVFGTVVDWRSGVAAVSKAVFEERGIDVDPFDFAMAWRAEYQPAMEKIRSASRGYVALDVLHRENLDKVLGDFGLEDHFDAAARADFNRAWEKLPPWPDAVAGLTRLKADYALATCSNGSIALMTWLAKFAGLPWDAILGAEIAHNYKPERVVYTATAAALGLDPGAVMMVAAHNGDLQAARDAGLKTAFVPRPTEYGPGQTTDLEATSDWEAVADDFEDLAGKLCR